MNEVDLRLMRAAVAVADELNFSRAAQRLRVSQPALSKQIQDLEGYLHAAVFDRDHQRVLLTDAGRAFVQEARLSLTHHQLAIQAARSVSHGAESILNFGQSPYMDPFLTSIVSTVQLPLFPDLRIHVSSAVSPELVRQVEAAELDLALVTQGSEQHKLAAFELAQTPLFALIQDCSSLADHESLTIDSLGGVPWIMFAQHVHPFLCEGLVKRASASGVFPRERHHMTSAEHAAQLVSRIGGVAFLTRHGAWKVALDGLTLRPLNEPDLRIRSVLVARIDAGRVVSEFVRAAVKRIKKLTEPEQGRLPLAG